MIKLYQFQFSHFCKKASWALDYKGLPYKTINLLPGLHTRVTRKLAPLSSLPILVDGQIIIQDSTAIITYLDEKYPARPLTPQDTQQATEALEWEEYLDEEIGVPLRLWFYYHSLPERNCALGFLLDGAPWYGRPLLSLIYPGVSQAMRKLMNINSASAKQSLQRLLTALDRLDAELKQRQFLVSGTFTRADLTACSLLSPFCAPGKSDNQVSTAFPAQVKALRDQHKNRPYFKWVQEMHREYHQPDHESA